MSDHAKLAEVIDLIEEAQPDWIWLAGRAFPGGQDKYVATVTTVTIDDNGVSGRICKGWGPSSHEALQVAYADAVRSLN